MMKNHDESVKTNHKLNWSYIPEHPLANHSWSLSNPGSGAGKTDVILNLIKYQRLDVGKIYLYIKNPFESKYQFLISGREKVGIKQTKKSKGNFFFYFSQTIDDVYENLEKIHKRIKNVNSLW